MASISQLIEAGAPSRQEDRLSREDVFTTKTPSSKDEGALN
jgi:hypothetical protein